MLYQNQDSSRSKKSMAMIAWRCRKKWWAIYKEKVNPMAGCLPILMQMPIFLAIVLGIGWKWSCAMRLDFMDSGFVAWWIHGLFYHCWWGVDVCTAVAKPAAIWSDASKSDEVFTDYLLPLYAVFPSRSGAVLTVNNLFSMTQQYVVNRKVEEEQNAVPLKYWINRDALDPKPSQKRWFYAWKLCVMFYDYL